VPDAQDARDAMTAAQARAQAELMASPEWTSANAELAAAQSALDTAANRVRQSLAGRADYQSATAAKAAADAAVSAFRAAEVSADTAAVTPAAERKLAAAKRLMDIETAALAGDPEWTAAKTRHSAAAAKRNALLGELRGRVQQDPAWQAALDQLNAVQGR
jgi:hypothetical protein